LARFSVYFSALASSDVVAARKLLLVILEHIEVVVFA